VFSNQFYIRIYYNKAASFLKSVLDPLTKQETNMTIIVIESSKMNCAGHVISAGKMRIANKLLVRKTLREDTTWKKAYIKVDLIEIKCEVVD
jgi:hypothetical protein